MKTWNKTRYENEVKSIINDFWAPLSNSCKKAIKFVENYRTIEGFKKGVEEGFTSLMAYEKAGMFNFEDEETRQMELANLCRILMFIEDNEDDLLEYEGSIIFKESPVIKIDEDDADYKEPVRTSTEKPRKPITMIIDEDDE